MKFLIVLTLFAAIAYALPVEEIGQNQEIEEAPVALVDVEAETSDDEESDVARPKRQFGGFGYPGGYGGYGGYGGGYGGYPGGYGGYGGYGHGGYGHHHHHHGHHHHGGYYGK